MKESEHILTKFDDLQASFSPSLGLRYAFLGMLFVTMLNCIFDVPPSFVSMLIDGGEKAIHEPSLFR